MLRFAALLGLAVAVGGGLPGAASPTGGRPPRALAAASGKPGGWFPDGAPPRDGLVVVTVVDVSCDETPLTRTQLRSLLLATITLAAFHEGTSAIAPLRNNAIVNLPFLVTRFHSTMESDESVRRDLWHQRNEVSLDGAVAHVVDAAHGPCRTDGLEALKQVQSELSSLGAGGRPADVIVVSNGVVVARGVDFRAPQPPPAALVRRLAAAHEVASLPGVRLVFVGLGRSPGIGSRKLDWLEQFWTRYARAAGGRATLVRGTDEVVARIRGAS
jgi:hypothetical protein